VSCENKDQEKVKQKQQVGEEEERRRNTSLGKKYTLLAAK